MADDWDARHAAINSYKSWQLAISELRKRRLRQMANEFKPNWALSPRDKLIVALCIVLPQHIPDWQGCTDEQMARMADDIMAITEAPDETQPA